MDKCYKQIYGEHPHGGVRALVYFYDKYYRPCREDDSVRAIYIEYDARGEELHSMVLYGQS